MIPCLHFGLRPASGRFTIEPKLASWVESGYKSPQSPGPRQRGRRRDGLSRRRRGRFRSTAPYPAATNSRGVSKPRARRDNGLTLQVFKLLEDQISGVCLHSTGLKGGKSVLGLLDPKLVDSRVGLVETCKQGFDQSRGSAAERTRAFSRIIMSPSVSPRPCARGSVAANRGAGRQPPASSAFRLSSEGPTIDRQCRFEK